MGMVKKVIQQGHSPFGVWSVLPVREQDKWARTKLVAFFNIPFMKRYPVPLGVERPLMVEMNFFIDAFIGGKRVTLNLEHVRTR